LIHIERFVEGNVVVTTVRGRLDSSSSPKLDEFLASAPAGGGVVLLDFADLSYISSAGLRVVLKATKLARSTGSTLAVCSLIPQVHEVFDVSGFSTLIPIHPNREAALATLA